MKSFNDVRSKTLQDVQILEEEIVYQGYFKIKKYHFQYQLFSGAWSPTINREVFERGNAVGILLYDPSQDKVVLIEQFRAGALRDPKSPWLVEIVAGIIDPDEQVEEVAHRETQEETGITVQRLLPIYTYWPSPGGSTEQLSLFCGLVDSSQAGGIHGLAEESEDIRTLICSTSEAFEMVQSGFINNAATIIALQWLELNLSTVKQKFGS